MNTAFITIFDSLKKILKPYESQLVLVTDNDVNYYLDTAFIMKNNQPQFFASVTIKKNYVSYHLMPVYCRPELLNDLSTELKKRMQGKSCFNFKKPDSDLFEQLKILTDKGMQSYIDDGVVVK